MNICDAFPFIRYARYMNLDKSTEYPYYIPYDARFFYVLSGEGSIIADSKKYVLNKYDAIFINSGIEYHLETPERQISYIALNFDYIYDYSKHAIPIPPDTEKNFDKSKIIHRADFDDVHCFNTVAFFKNFRHEELKLEKIKDEYTKRLIFHELNESKIFSEVLIEAVRRSKLCNLSDNNKTVEKILDYVHENYAKPITNVEIGNILGFHPNYINYLVKLSTGMSLHQYIMHTRISCAVNMLDSGKYSIAQIAESCGFCDVFHFSHCFKSKIGMPPSKYNIN